VRSRNSRVECEADLLQTSRVPRPKKNLGLHPELGLPEVRKLWQTDGLFSDHYLKARLQKNSWWPSDAEAEPIWKFCKELYEKRYLACAKNNEAFTRQELLDKILEKIGFAWTDNLGMPDQDSEPDYILFSSAEEKEKVIEASKGKRYAASVAILEAKKVNHPLSQISKHQQRYPHQQIRDYLNEAQVLTWSILANGNEWRLYTRDAKPSQFFGLNFEIAIKSLGDFKVFLALFSAAAFARDAQGKCRLDQIREIALATQSELEADLRARIFTIVEILANGFAERPENKITDADLPRLYENCLIYLYRLLFILYAEGRLLLPVEPKSRKYYKQLSLARLLTPLKNYTEFDSQTQTRFYRDIHALSLVINGTDKKANDEFGVPRYNGGLFDPDHHPLLQEWAVADFVLAEVLRQLMFTPEKGGQKFVPFESVDYADLSVQQLGSIYEGLLEHHFIRKDGRLKLETDKGERKATGTYYTPDYIVKYIVEKTLGPLLAEIEERPDVKAGKENSFAKEILKLNICDPAMGSGHFLVEATIYLADHIVYHPTTKFQAEFSKGESQEGTEISYWRRRVVEACIYGVDLNPLAVELAKLSLWLTTIASDSPLNFLDHHLRCGNSLIGARLDQLGSLPQKKGRRTGRPLQQILIAGSSFKQAVTEAISQIHEIETGVSSDVAQVKEKEKRWEAEVLPRLAPYKKIADLWTNTFFDKPLSEEEYLASAQEILAAAKVGENQMQESAVLYHIKEMEKPYFHWELEFPEVFFSEDGSHKENAGFDAVVTNPPYDILKRSADERLTAEISYLRQAEKFAEALGRTFNLYRPFILIAAHVLRKRARTGLIVPLSVLNDLSSTLLRKFLFTNCHVSRVEAFPQKDDPNNRVFAEAKLSTCIMLIQQGVKGDKIKLRIHPGKEIEFNSPEIEFNFEEVKKFDPVSWSIPIVTVQDWKVCSSLYSKPWISNFEQFVDCLVGEIDLTLCRPCITQSPQDAIMLKGTQVYPYFTTEELKQGEKEWVNASKYGESFANPAKVADRKMRRLTMQGVTGTDDRRRLKAAFVEPGTFLGNSVNYLRLKPGVDYDLGFFCALLNSQFIEWRFRLTSSNNNVNNYEVDALPLREIKFSTAPAERKRLTTKARALYESSLATKAEHILDFTDKELAANHADVIHDLLAYLAGQMTDLNTEKQTTAKTFRADLKDFHDIEVRSLTPKTKLAEFWKLETTELFAHLHANKIRIKESEEEKIRSRFQKAKDKLIPLDSQINFTDTLIDQIVYRLYGLTADEIKIVELRS
jgi:Alw26I/Eco31I/Esp3I family type II restriction m6 adenine DNA methyltransferase